jgi:tetratricopeptide (TPR) repeat protein
MRTILVATTLLFSSAASAYSISEIDQAASAMDLQQLQTYAAQSAQPYVKAYAYYRLAITASEEADEATMRAAIDCAEQILAAQLEAEPEAEHHTLQAAVLGLKMGLNPLKGVTLGPKQQRHLNKAAELAPKNPRVELVRGIAAFYTPGIFGGGVEKAENHFTQALTYYEQPCVEICWGHAETLTWLGLVYQQQGKPEEARASWRQADVVEPGYGWANYLLQQAGG